mmetsp:Transcript_31036/g.66929  ORF Transcript_31036/g.66929 Transcript_31036/m.66929 type:complete len:239 (-) Transcript_31036:832-1548(-)
MHVVQQNVQELTAEATFTGPGALQCTGRGLSTLTMRLHHFSDFFLIPRVLRQRFQQGRPRQRAQVADAVRLDGGCATSGDVQDRKATKTAPRMQMAQGLGIVAAEDTALADTKHVHLVSSVTLLHHNLIPTVDFLHHQATNNPSELGTTTFEHIDFTHTIGERVQQLQVLHGNLVKKATLIREEQPEIAHGFGRELPNNTVRVGFHRGHTFQTAATNFQGAPPGFPCFGPRQLRHPSH